MRGNRSRVAGRGRVGRLFRAAVVVVAGLVSGFALYVLLVGLGVLPKFYPSASGDLALARSDRVGLRVLFVGNSITYTNDMPALVHQLAAADPGARPIFAVKYTAGGWRLKFASEDDGLAALLKEVPWDVVVEGVAAGLRSTLSTHRSGGLCWLRPTDARCRRLSA